MQKQRNRKVEKYRNREIVKSKNREIEKYKNRKMHIMQYKANIVFKTQHLKIIYLNKKYYFYLYISIEKIYYLSF